VDRGLAQLREDLDSGDWSRRYGDVIARDELDVGLRLITAGR
jgi:hypothetical protein